MIGDWEVPSIERIELSEGRRLARLGVPGLAGDLHQDLGAESLTVSITGSLQGDDLRSGFLTTLREAYNEGTPLTFVSDITEASDVEEVLVVGFDVAECNDWGDEFRYRILLRQYVEPPEPPGLLDDLGADLIPDLDDLAGALLDALDLPALLGTVPDVADPTVPLQPALDAVRDATAAVPALLGGLSEALEL
ncbi:MAG TPA: hypothetical protein VHJ34_14205 [Actinomycetota bacterium]|nr:hypothetical protein [Actinomycetota bacterium]